MPLNATFISFTPGDIATSVGYTASLLQDLSLPILLIIGVSVGLIIYWGLLHPLKK